MAISSANAAAAPKVRKVETLNSGTSWTVPSNVDFINVTLIGGGGSGGSSANTEHGWTGHPGQIITTTVNTTPGASIAYAIGAGGIGTSGTNNGAVGGTTTFTGATSAVGGRGGTGYYSGTAGTDGLTANNAGAGGSRDSAGGNGGAGQIIIEYWV